MALQPQSNDMLQLQAIQEARTLFSKLPRDDITFQQCIESKETISEVLETALQQHKSYRVKRGTRIMEKFQHYTTWLRSISEAVDIVVQTQAGIGCPLWAPIKFLLKTSTNHHEAGEHILRLVTTMVENLPRFEMYQRLQTDPLLQTSLLHIFTDVVEFTVMASKYFSRNTFVRVVKQVQTPFQAEFDGILERINRHSRAVDKNAVAVELARAAEYRKARDDSAQVDMKLRLESWLKPANMRVVHQVLSDNKLTNTCEWIWTNQVFVNWVNSTSGDPLDRLLSIHGKNGCGKSALASWVVTHHRDQENANCLFFAFSGTDGDRRTTESMIKSLLWQLIILSSDHNGNGLDIGRKLIAKSEPLEEEFWDAFKSIEISETLLMVIDGIDEAAHSHNLLFKRLVDLLRTKPTYRVILLGRSHALEAAFNTTNFSLEMTAQIVENDINSYISSEVDKDELLHDPEIKNTIIHQLQAKSDGMFLWAKLMLSQLGRCGSKIEVIKRLGDLPTGLEKAYISTLSRLVDQLDSYDVKFLKVLEIASIAFRPLTIEEMCYAYTLASSPEPDYESRLETRMAQKVLMICAGLIVVTNGTLTLLHFSLKEFLARPHDEWPGADPRLEQFHVDFKHANWQLCMGFVTYLSSLEYQSLKSEEDPFVALPERYKFLQYATRYGVLHLEKSGEFLSPIILEFIDCTGFFSWFEYFCMLLLDNPTVLQGPMNTLYQNIQHYEEAFHTSLQRRITTIGKTNLEAKYFMFFLSDRDNISSDYTPESTMEVKFWDTGGTRREICDSSQIVRVNSSSTTLEAMIDSSKESSIMTTEELDSISPMIVSIEGASALSPSQQFSILITFQYLHKQSRSLTGPLSLLLQAFIEHSSIFQPKFLDSIADSLSIFGEFERAIEFRSLAMDKADSNFRFELAFNLQEDIGGSKRYADQEIFCREWLQKSREYFGTDHAQTEKWLVGLSDSLYCQHKFLEDETVSRQLWESRKRRLGEDDRETLRVAHYLSKTLFQIDPRKSEAEQLCRQTLNRWYNFFGEKDRDVLQFSEHLLRIVEYKEDFAEMERIHRQILEINRHINGDEDEDTMDAASDLIYHLINRENYLDAELLCLEFLEVQRRVLGDRDEMTTCTVHDLRVCLSRQGKYQALEILDYEVFRTVLRLYPKAHRKTLLAVNYLMHTYFRNGKDRQAEKLLRRFLKYKIPPKFRCIYLFQLGILLYRKNTWQESECEFQKCLEVSREMNDEDSDIGESNTIDREFNDESDEGEDTRSENTGSSDTESEFNHAYLPNDTAILQELEYVLSQQGKLEEARKMRAQIFIEEEAGRSPWLWEDIEVEAECGPSQFASSTTKKIQENPESGRSLWGNRNRRWRNLSLQRSPTILRIAQRQPRRRLKKSIRLRKSRENTQGPLFRKKSL